MNIFDNFSLERLFSIEGHNVGCLGYMGIGMLGIFIIIGIIIAATYATAYLTEKLAKPSDDE
jgi:hypothetical protein